MREPTPYPVESAGEEMRGKYLAFSLDNRRYGVPLCYVEDMIRYQPVTRVPHCPDYLLGITNLRGKVIPVIDPLLRFYGKRCDCGERTCIVVISDGEVSLGFVVDGVSEVATVPPNELFPPPDNLREGESRFLSALGNLPGGILLVLDCEAILNEGTEK